MLRHRIRSVWIRSVEDTFIVRICWGIGYFRCGYVKTEDKFTIGYVRDRILTVGGYLVTRIRSVRIRSARIRSERIPSDRIRPVGAP